MLRLPASQLFSADGAALEYICDGNGAPSVVLINGSGGPLEGRISAGLAGRRDVGHSGAMGMTWHDGGDTESLSVTARPEDDGTAVSVVLDRRATLGTVATFSGVGMFLGVIASGVLYDVAPALGFAGAIATIGGGLAVVRGYWKSSTRKVRERISVIMDTIGETLSEPER